MDDENFHIAIKTNNIKLKSINRKYTGNFKLTTEYKVFLNELLWQIKKTKEKIPPPYEVHIYLKTYIDLDNPLKPILDCLEKSVITNDRYVKKLVIIKNDEKRGRTSSLIVKVKGNYEPPLIDFD